MNVYNFFASFWNDNLNRERRYQYPIYNPRTRHVEGMMNRRGVDPTLDQIAERKLKMTMLHHPELFRAYWWHVVFRLVMEVYTRYNHIPYPTFLNPKSDIYRSPAYLVSIICTVGRCTSSTNAHIGRVLNPSTASFRGRARKHVYCGSCTS